jgi:hypothetical protein
MLMKKTAFAFILLVSACSSDVELELNVSGPKTQQPPQGAPAAASLGDLAWSFIAPEIESSAVTHMEWIPDGGVIAAGGFARVDGRGGGNTFLARIAADGSPVWLTEIERDDLVELTGGFGDAVVEYSVASLASMDRFDDGRILVGLNLEVGLLIDGWAPSFAFFAFLRWYDGDGNLLETRSFPEPADRVRGDDDDESFPAAHVGSVLALPDGGGLFTGRIGNGGPDTVVQIVRFDADGEPVWTTTSDTGENISGLTATPDGGILLHGMFFESVTVGDQTVEAPYESGAFAARLEADDGTCTWLQSFDGASHLLFRGGIGSAPGGNVIAAGAFYRGSVQAGELELSATKNSDNYFLSELGPDGEVLSLSEIEHLPPVVSGVNDTLLDSASVADGTVVMGGLDTEWNDELTIGFRAAFIAVFDFSGQLLAERRMFASQDELNHGVVHAVAIAPDGGVLAGGFWEHEIDLGDGNVLETTEPQVGQMFVAVYHPLEEDPVVDLITTP